MKVIRLSGVLALVCALGVAPASAQKRKAAPKPPAPQISDATRQKAAVTNANPEALVHFIRSQSGGILLVVTIFAALYMLTVRLMKPDSRV